jgi:hypothetical protein
VASQSSAGHGYSVEPQREDMDIDTYTEDEHGSDGEVMITVDPDVQLVRSLPYSSLFLTGHYA